MRTPEPHLVPPPGERIRLLHTELTVLADEIVEELLRGTPGLSALVNANETIDDESLRRSVGKVLFTALGFQRPEDQNPSGGDRGPDHESDGPHDGRHEASRPDTRELARHTGPGPARHGGHAATEQNHARDQQQPAAPSDRAPCARPRQELFTALTDARAAPRRSLTELAEAAGWPLAPAVRGVVLATPGETQQLAAVLDESLAGMFAGRPCLLVPSLSPSPGPDARARLGFALRGRLAVVGHEVPLKDTASSLRCALRLLTLTPARQGSETQPVFVDDHLSTLILLQDEPLAQALAAQWLRPLAGLTPRQSERLEATLLAWLECGGAPEAAKALNVHPQTVRYRMRRLEKLFGPQLRDPRARFELEMTLHSRRLMTQIRIPHVRQGRRADRVTAANFTPLAVERSARVNGL
ncbi:PucR family transcriptional regulator [Streptomyces sp. NBC_01006]|uniref:PucR family transcriptional regulator n=1 Tax=Streptomyces sp. NBC_01006 TaxID=2903716 RepID=UPI003863438B|nr:helix-turn-helix domain-containing protein [Streptomyces sp. NBC_01006]